MAKEDAAAMTPVAAVARHLEWLEFALAAARDEEGRRRERLGRATDKNREKRTLRLAEVTAEVRELGALVAGLKELQARPVPASRAAAPRRARSRATAKPKTPRATKPTASPAARPAAAAPAKRGAAASAANSAATSKPASKPPAAKTRTRRRTRKPPAPSA